MNLYIEKALVKITSYYLDHRNTNYKKIVLDYLEKSLDKYFDYVRARPVLRNLHTEAFTLFISSIDRIVPAQMEEEKYLKLKDDNHIIHVIGGTDFIIFKSRDKWLSEWRDFNVNDLPPTLKEKVSKLFDAQEKEQARKLLQRLINLRVFL